MKKLLLILLCLPLIGFGQNIYIPDDAFEQELINLGVDNVLDDSVSLSAIDTITYLDIAFPQTTLEYIYDITGIQFFSSLEYFDAQAQFLSGTLNLTNSPYLEYLNCGENDLDTLFFQETSYLEYIRCDQNNLSFIQVSNCFNLKTLRCNLNFLDNLDITNCAQLEELQCQVNQLTTIDVSNNSLLKFLSIGENQINTIDLSFNYSLEFISCSLNPITNLDLTSNSMLDWVQAVACNLYSVDLRNGNNTNIGPCFLQLNANNNLTCINVDDTSYANNTWNNSCFYPNIDPQMFFNESCQSYFCNFLDVSGILIDNSNNIIDIAIYNGSTSFLYYPYVAFTIDANGDTLQKDTITQLFAAFNYDTTWYNYSILSNTNATYPLTMYFVYQFSTGAIIADTCILTYNPTSTAITDINTSGNRKLISTVDFLGRESKGTRNEPLFYIYDDGIVEKKIIFE